MRLLGQDRGRVLALGYSVDPLNDTPASIRSFLAKNRATGEIRYVDGTVAELRPIWTEFKIMASHGTGSSNMHPLPFASTTRRAAGARRSIRAST